jgi:hypothetical protein
MSKHSSDVRSQESRPAGMGRGAPVGFGRLRPIDHESAQHPSFLTAGSFRRTKQVSLVFFEKRNNSPEPTGKQRGHVVRFSVHLC